MSTKILAPGQENPRLRILKRIWKEYSIIFVTIFIFALAGILDPRFIQPSNMLVILNQATFVGVIAIGMTFVIITGGIDLSSGHVMATAGAVLITLQGMPQMPLIVAILVCFAVSALIGLVNGLIITKLNIPPFIATLAVGIMARSIAVYSVGGGSITGIRDPAFLQIGNGSLGFMPYSVMIWIALAVICGYILKYTRYGTNTYAVGGNELAAKFSGIATDKTKIMAYTLTGFCAGVAALLSFSRMASVTVPTSALGFEFEAITAAIVGGTALSGGRGRMLGTFLGAIILVSITNMVTMLGVSLFLTGFVKGLVVLVAVMLQSRQGLK